MQTMINGRGVLPNGGVESNGARTRRSLVLFACGALIGLALAAYSVFGARSASAVPAEAVALVNGRPILRSDFETQVHTQFNVGYASSTPDQRRRVLNDMIAEELNVQRGVELELPNTDPDVRAAMVAGVELEVTANVLAQQPTQQQLRDWYSQHREKYLTDASFRMLDLVLHARARQDTAQLRAEAAQAVDALRAGRPVSQVVRDFSLVDSGGMDTDPVLDFEAKARLDAAVYAAASRLATGAVSNPVITDDGAHVVVMIEHQVSAPQDFAAASERVWTDYKKEAQNRVLHSNVNFLRGRADVQLADDAKAFAGTARQPKDRA